MPNLFTEQKKNLLFKFNKVIRKLSLSKFLKEKLENLVRLPYQGFF